MSFGLEGAALPPHLGRVAGAAFRVRHPSQKGAANRGEFSGNRPLTVGPVLHIWPFTDGAGSLPNPVASLLTASRCPGSLGREMCRLFDIVGLDEGTCGRRPRSPRSSRPRRIGSYRPFHMSRYISTVYVMCRNGSLKPALDVRVFPRAPMVGHKLESLILAQNERWRHA